MTSRQVEVNGKSIHVVETIPETSSTSPTVVIVPGLGQTSTGWAAVQRLLPPNIRSFSYDRLGLGRSDRTIELRPAATLAKELKETLGAAGVPSPYLLVGHSYGGVICREFLQAFDEDVAGMVFVDANQERTHIARDWPFVASARLIKAAWSTDDASGLAEAHRCTDDEWQALVDEERNTKEERENNARTNRAVSSESAKYVASLQALGEHKQLDRQALGSRPCSVILANLAKDVRGFAEAGKADGGSDENYQIVVEYLDRLPGIELELANDTLRISSLHRLVKTSISGHLVNLWEPELCVQEILWCLERVKEGSR